MSKRLPLPPAAAPAAPLFLGRHGSLSHAGFAAAALELAQRLPPQDYRVNLCEDRRAFSLALLAQALRGGVSLLPPSNTPAALDSLARRYGAPPALHDDEVLAKAETAQPGAVLPPLPAMQAVAMVFTSGSTGEPQPQMKTWSSLLHSGTSLSTRLLGGLGACSVVATVPPQHMYGLETSVMMPLAGGHAVWTGRPAFPEDVREALAAMPAPRVLITTPVHIRALLADAIQLPPLACIVSATAPLPQALAQGAEQAFGAPVMEIYGCSEAGSIATRHTIEGDDWLPLDGVSLAQRNGRSFVLGDHLDGAVLLQDELELHGAHFRLGGRNSDMLKVAGKRASLADLTGKLLSIEGVLDGVVFQPEDGGVVQRPAALVVAPTLSENEILAALGRLIDPVFLPRPLRKVDSLPRNAVGKLPRASLHRLLADA